MGRGDLRHADCDKTPLSKYLRAHRTEFLGHWECIVIDVVPYENGVAIQCAVRSTMELAYRVVGTIPKDAAIARRDHIRFHQIDTGEPLKGDPRELVYQYGRNRTPNVTTFGDVFRFAYLTFEKL